jgi:hypothetical protein
MSKYIKIYQKSSFLLRFLQLLLFSLYFCSIMNEEILIIAIQTIINIILFKLVPRYETTRFYIFARKMK